MNVCILCSASDVSGKYAKPAVEMAERLGRAGHTLLICGVTYGLVKVVADCAQQHGSRIIGVLQEPFAVYANEQADELVVTKSLSENKAALLGNADVIVVLAGGLGTLDEATEIMELKKQGRYHKPLIIVNTEGYYNGLKLQLQHMENEGFLPAWEHAGIKVRPLSHLVRFVDTPAAAAAGIKSIRVSASAAS